MLLCSLAAILSAFTRRRADPVCFDGILDELFEAWPVEAWEEQGALRAAA
jgi:hypothetical protein